jgi:hypothetical protein
MSAREHGDEIGRAIEEVRASRQRRSALAEAAWRAGVDEHLRAIDDAIADLRLRINGIFALLAAAVVGQVALRLLGH